MHVKFKTVVAIALLGATLSCVKENQSFPDAQYACTGGTMSTLADSSRFRTFLEEKVAAGIPGMTLLVESPQGQWRGAAGFADLQSKTKLKPCNVLRVGSITKTFTAILILLLQEDGMLNLDDRIRDYLPTEVVERVLNADQATIRQLLNHTSGIADYSDMIDFSFAQLDRPTRKWTALQELKYVYDEEAQFSPGEKRNYCNTNYLLLGMVAEKASGHAGAKLFQEKIFDALSLNSTYFSQEGVIPNEVVRGYWDERGDLNLRDATEVSFGHHSMAGGICSSLEDLNTLMKALRTPGLLLTRESLEEMLATDSIPQLNTPKTEGRKVIFDKYSLGLFHLEYPDFVGIGHGGRIRGYSSFMLYFPEIETTFIYMMNGSNGSIKELEREIYLNEIADLFEAQ